MAKNENKRVYELIIALKPLLPDEVRKEIHKEFVDLVESQDGEVLDVDVWGKRYLSYDIDGQSEAYYILYNYEIAPEHIAARLHPESISARPVFSACLHQTSSPPNFEQTADRPDSHRVEKTPCRPR